MRQLQIAAMLFISAGSAVAARGGQTCTYPSNSSKFSQIVALNNNPVASGGFGASVRVRKVTIGGTPLLETVVGTVGTNKIEIFFLDPATGAVRDGTTLANGSVQNHISIAVPLSMAVHHQAIGDFDSDGAPDIVIGNKVTGTAWIDKSQFDATTGVLTYGPWYQVKPASGEYLPANYGESVGTGKLYGSVGDIAAVGASGAANSSYGGVFLFYWNGAGFSEYSPIYDPDRNTSNFFGASIAIGALTSAGSQDLVVGADSTAARASNSGAGKVWTFPAGSLSGALALTNNVSNQNLGSKVGIADVTGDSVNDLVALTEYTSNDKSGFIWDGYVHSGEPASLKFVPNSSLADGWSTGFDLGDINGDGIADILVGAPNASPSGCPSSAGAAYVYLSQGPSAPNQFTTYIMYPPNPANPDYNAYGWSMATIQNDSTNRIFVVGEKSRDITLSGVTYTGAGQVYVYKVN